MRFSYGFSLILLQICLTLHADELPNLATRKKGDDWQKFLGPTGKSISTEKGMTTPWPAKGLRIVWHQEVGEGYAMPSISKGRLFHFDRKGNKATLTCMNAETGKEICHFDYPTDYRDQYNYSGGPRCCPVIEDNRVYIYGPAGMLHCLELTRKDDKESFRVLWKVNTTAQYGVIQNFFGVGSTPIIEGDLLITQVGGSPKGSDEISFLKVKGNGSAVVAFNKMTGKVVWKTSDELASYSSPVLATIKGKRWCFVFARAGLLGLDPKTGKVRFHFPWRSRKLESVNAANPVIHNDKIFISETYGPGSAYLQIKDDGVKVLWSDVDKPRSKSMQCHWMTPILVDGYLYGCSGRHDSNAELRCIELATGKVMWSKPGLARTSLLKVGDYFLSLGEYGDLRLLKINPKKYDEVSVMIAREPDEKGYSSPQGRILLRYPCWAAPILSHGLLYLRGNNRLICLELIPQKGIK